MNWKIDIFLNVENKFKSTEQPHGSWFCEVKCFPFKLAKMFT